MQIPLSIMMTTETAMQSMEIGWFGEYKIFVKGNNININIV